ncbi:MAG: hypothetical protein IIZ36_05030 [Ruminococcus sp.]|nr:hypothetical protein [Ruminococcus sp.]
MKKVLTVLAAILMLAISVFPAFAEEVRSPEATKASYKIVVQKPEGGRGYRVNYEIKSGIKENGRQTVRFYVDLDEGSEFESWTIEGDYDPDPNLDLTKPDIEIEVFGDVNAVPNVKVPGTEPITAQETTEIVVRPSEAATTKPASSSSGSGSSSSSSSVSKDKGSTSPQTGSSNTVAYIVLFASAAICCTAVVKYSKSR